MGSSKNTRAYSNNKKNNLFFGGKKNGESTMSLEDKRKFILNENTDFQVREAYKAFRTNIIFSLPEENSNKIIITSSLEGEGKSTTCLNTAISFAETNKKVVVVDCDLRRPNIANLLDIPLKPGLTNVLVRMNSLESVIRKNVRPNLDIITAGDIPPNPSELLDSERMKNLMETLSQEYDYVFLDTPPVLVVTDTAVLTRYCSGVILLAHYNRTDRNAVSAAVEQLRLANAKILGGILNGAESEGKSYGYKRYGRYGGKYGYGYSTNE
ncbi:MAG: CpsD/CapB family tyrosine-protein kinase [Oscillospiraceae bacterium]|nr:CpsD/CapB family tyrosine-protein kinase [Oscillospiraceae bacterium]